MRGLRRGLRLLLVVVVVVLATACASSGGDLERSSDETRSSDGTGTSGGSSVSAGEEPFTLDEARALRLGLTGVETFDPSIASAAEANEVLLADLLYDTLTTIGDDGAPERGLATFFSNEDQTLWRFELDEDATFADGTAITADDVVFSIERLRSGSGASLAGLRLDGVASIAALDERTVDITLERPSAVLPELLSSPLYGITSRASIEAMLAGGDQTPNASGDFDAMLDGGQRLLLRRRHGDGVEGVIVRLFDDEEVAYQAFLDGQIDWTVPPADRLDEAIAQAGPRGLVPFHGGLFLGVDEGVDPLTSGRLRRAVALAIDRQALVDAVFGPTAQPARGIVPTGVPGGGTDCRGICGPAPDRARALIGEVFPEGQPRPLRLLVDDGESQQALGGAIRDQLEAVGLEVELDALPLETYQQLIASGRQQLFVYGWLGVARSPADHLVPLFESTSADNVSGLSDETVDFSLRTAETTADHAARASAWRDIEVSVLERVPVVPLIQFRTTGVLSERVEGFVLRADGSVDLSRVTVSG